MSTLAVVGVVAAGATGAFFSDSEQSTGNTFTAGAIDLTVGNSSYYTNDEGEVVHSSSTSWDRRDLEKGGSGNDGDLFFDFADLKPGDIGEDTITIQVDDNDAWACAQHSITDTPENGQTEPEKEDDDTAGENEGELQEKLMLAVWDDDGDNVFEGDERLLKMGDGDSRFISYDALADKGAQPLADSTYSVFANNNDGEPLEGGEEYHLGKAWCLGEMSKDPVEQQDGINPADDGTGFNCSGQNVNNETQTDGIEANVTFDAVQSRNNSDFVCGDQQNGGNGGDDTPAS